MTDDQHAKLVLDASAIIAYSHGNFAVGELIAEISDEGARFAVPLPCLVAAGKALDRDEWPAVDVLLGHTRAMLLDWPGGWKDVSSAARVLGDTSRAVAMLWAVARSAYLLTAEPDVFGDADFVIGV